MFGPLKKERLAPPGEVGGRGAQFWRIKVQAAALFARWDVEGSWGPDQ